MGCCHQKPVLLEGEWAAGWRTSGKHPGNANTCSNNEQLETNFNCWFYLLPGTSVTQLVHCLIKLLAPGKSHSQSTRRRLCFHTYGLLILLQGCSTLLAEKHVFCKFTECFVKSLNNKNYLYISLLTHNKNSVTSLDFYLCLKTKFSYGTQSLRASGYSLFCGAVSWSRNIMYALDRVISTYLLYNFYDLF